MAATTADGPELAALASAAIRRVRLAAERQPAWPVLAIGAVAWLGLVAAAGAGPLGGGTGHDRHAATGAAVAPGAAAVVALWLLMTVAMMVPTLVPAMYRLADVVHRRRRPLAVALVVGAVVLVWLPGAALAWALAPPLPAWAASALLVAAALWELTPIKRRALRRCHRFPVVRPSGAPFVRSATTFGFHQGRWCVVSCGPAMVAVAATGHALVPMGIVSVGVFAERVLFDGVRARRVAAAGLVAMAVLWVVVARS